jgi:hypothetical protein
MWSSVSGIRAPTSAPWNVFADPHRQEQEYILRDDARRQLASGRIDRREFITRGLVAGLGLAGVGTVAKSTMGTAFAADRPLTPTFCQWINDLHPGIPAVNAKFPGINYQIAPVAATCSRCVGGSCSRSVPRIDRAESIVRPVSFDRNPLPPQQDLSCFRRWKYASDVVRTALYDGHGALISGRDRNAVINGVAEAALQPV